MGMQTLENKYIYGNQTDMFNAVALTEVNEIHEHL